LEHIELNETEDYTKVEEISIKQIILRHIRKISDISSQELTSSYWQKKPIKISDGIVMSEIYKPDLRLAYSNSVDCLHDLIKPYIDDKFTKEYNQLKKQEKTKLNDKTLTNQDQKIWVKLKLRRKLFSEIMLLLNRIDFFEGKEYGE